MIGYWSAIPEEEGDLIHPQYLQNSRLQYAERGALATYWKRGVWQTGYLGYSFCRLPGGPPNHEMGDSEFTDGVWLWPQGLWVYVARYGVELPEEFVQHAERNGYRIPTDLDAAALERESAFDLQFWQEWCEKKKGQRKGVDTARSHNLRTV